MTEEQRQKITNLLEWKNERLLESRVTGTDAGLSGAELELIDLMDIMMEELNELSVENHKLKKQILKLGSILSLKE